MPIFDYRCDECGAETYDKFVKRSGAEVPCACGQTMRKLPCAPQGIHGGDFLDAGVKGYYSKQAGRYFRNTREAERWADKHGFAVVSSDSKEWRSIRDKNKNEADKDAKKEGFNDAEHRRKELKENKQEYRLKAAEKKIDAHHEEHGEADRATPEQFLASVDGKKQAS